MRTTLLLNLVLIAVAACSSASVHAHSAIHQSLVAPIEIGFKRATISRSRRHTNTNTATPTTSNDITNGPLNINIINIPSGGDAVCNSNKPPMKLLRWAYTAAGIATTSAWGTMVYTAIRDNQPPGAMMPSWQHPVFARIGALSAGALIVGSFASLAITCGVEESNGVQSWEELGNSSPSFRRQNLALATTGAASSLWV